MGTDMVRNGADGQRFRAEFCRHAVDTRRFHLYAQNAVLFHHVEHLRIWRIEQVSREDVADARVHAQRLSRVNRVAHHVEVSNRREVVILETHAVDFRVGAGAHADNDIAQLNVCTYCAARADADDLFHTKVGNQLFGVDRAGRDAHAVAHNGDFAAFIGAGISQHAAHVVYFNRIFQKGFRDVLRAQRVARHQHDVSEIAHFCINVRSCHCCLSFLNSAALFTACSCRSPYRTGQNSAQSSDRYRRTSRDSPASRV